jgi:hypothetical protein
MIPDDLIKAALALAKGATALDAAIPSGGIAKRLLGPAAVEVAEMWRDRVRLYRYERQLSCLKKAEKIGSTRGYADWSANQGVFPLQEGEPFEEDEDIHIMWAALVRLGLKAGERTELNW